MNTRKWLLNKFKSVNTDRLKKHVNIIHENSGRSKAYIYFDIIRSFITCGSGYTDYFRGNYVELTKEEKNTFATAKKFHNLLAYLNNPKYEIILGDKLLFNKYFEDYLKREYINLNVSSKEDFSKFLKGKDYVFAKRPLGEGGHDVKKITKKDYNDKLYNELKKDGYTLVEEAIIQSKDLNEINPNVVNSFRVITLYKDGNVYLVNNALRVNQKADAVIGSTDDLYFSLGVDGKINSNVIDDYGKVYIEHPLTHKKFSDVKIKGVKEAFDMCKEAALRLPEVRYIGWDIAFTDNGPVMVEGNEYPGYGLVQHYKLHDRKYGHLKEISDILGNEMKNIKL